MNLRRGAALLSVLLLAACAARPAPTRTRSPQERADEVLQAQMAPGAHATILKAQPVQAGPDGARHGLVLSFPTATGGTGYALAEVGDNFGANSHSFDQLPKTLAIEEMGMPLLVAGLIGDAHITELELTFVHEPDFKQTYHNHVAAPGFFLPIPPEVPFNASIAFTARDAGGKVIAKGDLPYPR